MLQPHTFHRAMMGYRQAIKKAKELGKLPDIGNVILCIDWSLGDKRRPFSIAAALRAWERVKRRARAEKRMVTCEEAVEAIAVAVL